MTRTAADSVAIIGTACRFAGAPNTAALWDMLIGGREGVRDYTPGRTAELDAFYGAAGGEFGPVNRRGGFLDDLDRFDPEFFNISPREAVFMDPQQRLLLEVSWEALEAAGQQLERIAGARTGVFVGTWNNDYGQQVETQQAVADIRSTVCNGLFGASSRIAFAFGFRGPEMSVNAGCASSLSALHQAVIALRSGACDLAVVAGVNAIIRPEITQAFGRAGALSPEGRCKFGDASADGFVRSDGAGVLILKRLEDAVAAGDRVHATVLGTAVNNNGSSGGFYMRPSEVGQAEAIRSALADAGVSAADLHYIEAHGTGTGVGDPIELNAVATVVGRHPDRTAPCLIGSVKSNLGHTEAAAGIAGVLKTVLALENKHIPPTLHVRERNPNIDWDEAGLALVTSGTAWPDTGPRRAGVSSFGLTGTNAHVILAEAPAVASLPEPRPRRAWALPISANSPEALNTLASRYAEALTARRDLPDICFTAATRRAALPHRAVAVGADRDDLAAGLRLWAERGEAPFVQSGRVRSDEASGVVLVFPGQGSQWTGMGRELIEVEPVFRDAITLCDAAVRAEVGWSVRDILLSPSGLESFGIERIQPTLFSVQVALAALWSSWGVKPDLVVGHSMGEIAAAHVAGALSLQDAASIICRRSAMMTRFTGQGAMTLVELPMADAADALHGYEDRVSIAVNNGPRSTVLAGEPQALAAVVERLESRGVFTRPVAVQVAAHSPQMDLIRDELHAALADLQPRSGIVPIYSTLLGRLTDGAECDARYWARNLREPVLFHPALKAIIAAGSRIFIEASPHPILLPAIEETARDAEIDLLTLASLRREEPEQATMLAGFGKLFAEGYPVDWSHHYPAGRVVDLPPHPFRRQRYWPESEEPRQASLGGGHPLLTAPVKTAEQSWIWTSRLNAELLPWLRDHAVRGAILLPASAYVEIALHAAQDVAGQAAVSVENLRLKEAITV
ncbi:MAG: type I polyketide synthase, partial [Acetobacteraceae bacterium]|nr:type I polyketide synthase [Acetobacteraceae bacterium]